MVAVQGQVLAGVAVAGQFGGEAGLAQALAQVLAGLGLVFDDQQFHVFTNGSGQRDAEMIRDDLAACPS